MSRCLNPQTSPEKAFKGSKHLLTMYLEDFGCLGKHHPVNLGAEVVKQPRSNVC